MERWKEIQARAVQGKCVIKSFARIKADAHRERSYATHGMHAMQSYVAFNRLCVFPICVHTGCKATPAILATSCVEFDRSPGQRFKKKNIAPFMHAHASTFGIPRALTPTPNPMCSKKLVELTLARRQLVTGHDSHHILRVIYNPQSPRSN